MRSSRGRHRLHIVLTTVYVYTSVCGLSTVCERIVLFAIFIGRILLVFARFSLVFTNCGQFHFVYTTQWPIVVTLLCRGSPVRIQVHVCDFYGAPPDHPTVMGTCII